MPYLTVKPNNKPKIYNNNQSYPKESPITISNIIQFIINPIIYPIIFQLVCLVMCLIIYPIQYLVIYIIICTVMGVVMCIVMCKCLVPIPIEAYLQYHRIYRLLNNSKLFRTPHCKLYEIIVQLILEQFTTKLIVGILEKYFSVYYIVKIVFNYLSFSNGVNN